MPTEAEHTRRFLKLCRVRHPEWEAIKFNDRTTKGIPDAAIIGGGHTMWIEFKRDPTGRKAVWPMPDRKGMLTEHQVRSLRWLYEANRCRALALVFVGERPTLIDIYLGDGHPLEKALTFDGAVDWLEDRLTP